MNKSKNFSVFFVLIAMVLVITGTIVFFYIPYQTIEFEESDRIIVNPSRGFYVQFDSGNLDRLNELSDLGVSLVFLAYDLNEFVDKEISQEKLDELTNAFIMIRAQGLKTIFRAAYGFRDAKEFSDPSSLEVIKMHLNQISPILKENADVLLTVQAGFLGQWGEWHHSNLGEDQGKPTEKIINELLVALCEAVPSPISIAVRRPSFIRMINPDLVDLSRIAIHNDALLSTDTDMGTYDLDNFSRDEELDYISNWNYPVANGGEMPNLSIYTEPTRALYEFTKLELTYLNLNYNKEVLNYWATNVYEDRPFIELIQKKLGYRLYIQTAILPSRFKSTQTVEIELTLVNSGFSAITLPYKVELIIGDNTGIFKTTEFKAINLQDIKPGKPNTITTQLHLNDIETSFMLGLRIIEVNATSTTDERTFVQLANKEIKLINGINYFVIYEWNGEDSFSLLRIN